MNQVNKDNLTDLVEMITPTEDNGLLAQESPAQHDAENPPIPALQLEENQVMAQGNTIVDLGIAPPYIK